MMPCEQVRESLPDHLYDLLPEWQQAEVAAHLRVCPSCAEAREAVQREFRLLDAWQPEARPSGGLPEFTRRLQHELGSALARPAAGVRVASPARPSPGWLLRWRGLSTHGKVAVTSVSLLAVAALAAFLAIGLSRREGQAQAGGPVVTEGIPPIGWAGGRHGFHISALQVALAAQGCPATYEQLMVASGDAFRTVWWTGRYHYGILAVAPEDLVQNAAAAAGAVVERRQFGSAEEAWPDVCQSIDEGRPVVAWQGWGAQVICGYDPQTQNAYTQKYNAEVREYQVGPLEEPKSFWPYNRPTPFLFVQWDPGREAVELDWPAILQRAIRFADRPPGRTLHGAYVCGLAAYDSWAGTLRGKIDENGPATDAQIAQMMALILADARTDAASVLREHATLHEALAEAANHYEMEATTVRSIPDQIAQRPGADWRERNQAMQANFADPAARERAAKIVEEAKAEEVLAVDALRRALKDLAPAEVETAPPAEDEAAPAAPASEAEAHYQRGMELKRAGKPAEAAEALRAALAADEKHVKTHYALGWVLLELKDKDGAVQEFRKVIELAPDSKEAQEAGRVIARIGG